MVTTYVDSESSHDVSLPLLTRLLEKISGLQRLDLHLNKESLGNFVTSYYRFRQVFPHITCWPNLTELRISGLAIEGLELIRLLQLRTRVCSLMLSGIELLSGTWEGVIEGLRYLCLSKLRLLSKLTRRGGAIFRPVGTEARDHDTKPEQRPNSMWSMAGSTTFAIHASIQRVILKLHLAGTWTCSPMMTSNKPQLLPANWA